MKNPVPIEGLCDYFGITARRYRQLAKEDVVPGVIKGKVDLLPAVQAFCAYQRALIQGSGELSLTEWRKKLVQIQCEKETFELAAKKAEYIPAARALDGVAKIHTSVISLLRGVGGKVAPVCAIMGAEVEIKTEVDEAIDNALREISGFDARRFVVDVAKTGAAHAETEPTPEPERVGKRKRVSKPRVKRGQR